MNRLPEDNLCWFHGKISRERAEEILLKEGREDGVFLVRESNSSNGDFVLTVLHQGQVWHYQIRKHGEDAFFSIDDNTKIHGLDSLIEHYQQSSSGLITKLSSMIKGDPPPNDTRSHGKTNLLHRATKENNQTVVSELLKCGYRNFDAKNQDGQTAVHLASIYSTEEILKLLIKAGANVNSRDTAGNTPLHYACRSKSASFIRILIESKANIQNRNIETGYVALHDAAKHGNMDAIQELLNSGAPHMPRTISGEFPMDLAKESGHIKIYEYLKEFKPLPSKTYKFQWYHGTLDRTEAINLIMDFEKNLKERLSSEEISNDSIKHEDITSKQQKQEQPVEKDLNENNQQQQKQIDTSGIYLVRYSNRSGYVLTLLCDGQPKNFIIQQSMKYLYIDEGPFMSSLEHLIQHYKTFSDGLPINLRYPVPPKPKPPLPLFSTMPKTVIKKHNQSSIDNKIQSTTTSITNSLVNNNANTVHRTIRAESLDETMDKKRDMHIFRSLKPRSPRKNIIIDGMKSLRKAKLKTSPFKNDGNRKMSNEEGSIQMDNSIQLADSLIRNLSFSTDFLNKTSPEIDGFYNIPKNNCAVVDIDIGEGGASVHTNPAPTSDNNLKGVVNDENVTNNNDTSQNELKSETTDEDDYFTKSDKDIEKENSYFVDVPNTPPPIPPVKSNCEQNPTSSSFVFTGYVPTVDIRVFLENNPIQDTTTEALAESSAQLREFSKHPERLDSIISTISSDSSEFSNFFNRQSQTSLTTSTANNSENNSNNNKTKLNYFIPSECLTLDTIIGEGEFGSVYKGSLKYPNMENGLDIRCPIAIKTLRDELSRHNKQEFLREASVMIQLKHHCIVKLIGISKGNTLMMIQELVPLGSMLNYIVNNSNKINPNYELKIWASQIACGMDYLESQHFVHRDLAARNILLASKHQVKISDFGLSRALGSGNECYQASQGGKWPIKWYAPESFNHGYFSHASDVWSFGITLWEMFSLGQPPYGEMRGVDAIKLIEKGHRLPKPQLCPDNVYKIMENCWSYKPKDRPTFRYLTEYFAKDPEYQNLFELINSEHIS